MGRAARVKLPRRACSQKHFCANVVLLPTPMEPVQAALKLHKENTPMCTSLMRQAERAWKTCVKKLLAACSLLPPTAPTRCTSLTKCTCFQQPPLTRCLKRSKNRLIMWCLFYAQPTLRKFPKLFCRVASALTLSALARKAWLIAYKPFAKRKALRLSVKHLNLLLVAPTADCATHLPHSSKPLRLEKEM